MKTSVWCFLGLCPSLLLVSNSRVMFLPGPTCRTLRTSPAASTTKCIAWGASTRTTRWWLTPTACRNITWPPTRCRGQPPRRRSAPQRVIIHLPWDFDPHWESSSPPLHPSPSHRWDRNVNAGQRGLYFSMPLGLFMSVHCLVTPSREWREVWFSFMRSASRSHGLLLWFFFSFPFGTKHWGNRQTETTYT